MSLGCNEQFQTFILKNFTNIQNTVSQNLIAFFLTQSVHRILRVLLLLMLLLLLLLRHVFPPSLNTSTWQLDLWGLLYLDLYGYLGVILVLLWG